MYRIEASGEVKSQSEIRSLHNASLPQVWTEEVCAQLGIEPVLESPAPQITRYQAAVKSGVERDALGNWVWAWTVTDLNAAAVDEQQAQAVRADRNRRLAGSDWTQGKDIPDAVSTPWAVYREELRNVPQQQGFPWDVVWPTPPGQEQQA